MEVLVAAWHEIQKNAETSRVLRTKNDARKFARNLPSNLGKIQKRLRKSYQFTAAYGATPPKGQGKDGKRPIVVAPLEDRIVQRAILDVLQTAKELPDVQKVLATLTSVGGVPGRGVNHAIDMFEERVKAGDTFVAGSDIAGFFNTIKPKDVSAFLEKAGAEKEFVELVERALTVELINALELSPEDRALFPDSGVGVAQGCPLSALAGNIVLQQFDHEMNGRQITCIRYIDDFLLIGPNQSKVEQAMLSARKKLKALGMDIYLPTENPNKAFMGKIGIPFRFLGYSLIPDRYPPAQSAIDNLYSAIDSTISNGRKSILKTIRGRKRGSSDRYYAQTLATVDNIVRGWSGSFRKCKCTVTFERIDAEVGRRLENFEAFFNAKTKSLTKLELRKALGVRSVSEKPTSQ